MRAFRMKSGTCRVEHFFVVGVQVHGQNARIYLPRFGCVEFKGYRKSNCHRYRAGTMFFNANALIMLILAQACQCKLPQSRSLNRSDMLQSSGYRSYNSDPLQLGRFLIQ